ncbi:conserved hypothetical protein [Histoplasma capsulatum G186AR]|uniref:Altered inheritance of mitochondria protein 9, mitochondrial n=1 Tax=Ajellomyces capsulatus (strain G186AR / H82 / ATCC MYA-2454 / RMSCC 2432) TaxID=447093 RepID=C0NPE5_AJECG|nr:uncharacterized protein HCBG_05025 [Histoplasma capsulatum G186AR]EEH06805.1 conserved hypothetical protein [Histoplasma capsulatum G186AR]
MELQGSVGYRGHRAPRIANRAERFLLHGIDEPEIFIDHDDLFRYSSGRWLVDEKQQLEQRFVKFNVERLCREAVSLFRDATKCVRVVKVEGNFNKAFLLTMDDGSEVIAKLPCRNAGTRSLITASEVATLQFWPSFLEFALSIPQREMDSIGDPKSELHHDDRFGERPSLNEYKLLLQKAIDILPILSRDPRVIEVAGPTLWHTDLHLGNIFVSPDDPTTILGIIDWQSSQVGPFFIQARFPEFLKPPKHYYPGTKLPTLPDNFDDLDSERKEQATKENILASQSKYYEMSSLANNKRVYDALKLDRRIWEPFTCCRRFSNGSMVPLRNSMIRISQDWTLLGLPGNCPLSFTEEELRRHNEQAVQYQDMLYLWDIVKTQLSTDDSGWVPVERWKKTNEVNRSLFDMYVETMSEELSPDVALKIWPFPPKDL